MVLGIILSWITSQATFVWPIRNLGNQDNPIHKTLDVTLGDIEDHTKRLVTDPKVSMHHSFWNEDNDLEVWGLKNGDQDPDLTPRPTFGKMT